MKKVVRQNCFETNSSSQHCIVVTKDPRVVDHDILTSGLGDPKHDRFDYVFISKYDGTRKNKLDISNVEGFGRWFEVLTSFKDKLMYALCEYLGYYYGDEPEFAEKYEEILSVVQEILPEVEDFYIYTKDIDIYLDQEGKEIKHKDLLYDGYDENLKVNKYCYKDKDGNKHPAVLDEENYLKVPEIGGIDHQSMGLLKNFLHYRGISLKEFLTNKKYVIVIDGDEICDWERYKKSGFINKDFIAEEYGKSDEDVEWLEWLKRQEENENESNTE